MSDELSPRTRKLRALALVFGVGAVVAMLFLGVVTVLQVRTDSERLLANSKSAREQRDAQLTLSKRLIECTTRPDLRKPPADIKDLPKDDCYAQQQAGAADFASPTGPFGVLVAVSSACGSAHPGDIPATQACVVKALRP